MLGRALVPLPPPSGGRISAACTARRPPAPRARALRVLAGLPPLRRAAAAGPDGAASLADATDGALAEGCEHVDEDEDDDDGIEPPALFARTAEEAKELGLPHPPPIKAP